MVQQARLALDRTEDLMREAPSCSGVRSKPEIDELVESLKTPLLEAKAHAAIFGARQTRDAGLSVIEPDPAGGQWQLIWRLWAKCYSIELSCLRGDQGIENLAFSAANTLGRHSACQRHNNRRVHQHTIANRPSDHCQARRRARCGFTRGRAIFKTLPLRQGASRRWHRVRREPLPSGPTEGHAGRRGR